MATTEQRLSALEAIFSNQTPQRFWQGMSKATALDLLDKIMVGMNTDGAAKYADINQIVNLASIAGGAGFKANITPASSPVVSATPVFYVGTPGTYPNFGGVVITGAAGIIGQVGTTYTVTNLNIDLSAYATNAEVEDFKSETNLFTFTNNETLNRFFKELYIDTSDYTGTAITALYCTLVNRNASGVAYAIVFKLNSPSGTEVLGFYADGSFDESTNVVTLISQGGSGLKGSAVVNWDVFTDGTSNVIPDASLKDSAYQLKLNSVILSDDAQDKVIVLNNDLSTQLKNTQNALLNSGELGFPESILNVTPSGGGSKSVTTIDTPEDFPISNILLPKILQYEWNSDANEKKFDFDINKIKGVNGLTFSFWVRDSQLSALGIVRMEYYAGAWQNLYLPTKIGAIQVNSTWEAKIKLVAHIRDWKLFELKLNEDAIGFNFKFITAATTGELEIANVTGVPDYNYVTSFIDVLYKTKDKGILSFLKTRKKIRADGDSLTMGTNEGKYPDILQGLLGDSATVENNGVGGESTDTIIARTGAFTVYSPVNFVLNANHNVKTVIADGTGLYLDANSFLRSMYDDYWVTPLLQMTPDYVNPVYINGIECAMSIVTKSGGNPQISTDNTWYINRVADGAEDIIIKTGTSISFGANVPDSETTLVAWIGTNGGYYDATTLAAKLKKYEEFNKNQKIIHIGLHASGFIYASDANRTALEQSMVREFGSRYFNWRHYATNYALADFGIVPTAKDAAERTALGWDSRPVTFLTAYQIANNVPSDIYQMSLGWLPSSLFRRAFREASDPLNDIGVLETELDSTHGNYMCYYIVANKVFERLRELKFI